MNKSFSLNFGESKFRKQYKYFNDGREYERNIHTIRPHNRILVISDLHVPFQLPISTFQDYFGKIDTLVLNGDLIDMQGISKFVKSYRNSPMEEIVECRQYIIDLIESISPKSVFVTYGNHEIRFQSYLAKNLDSDLLELMPMTPLDLIIDDGFRRYDKRSKSKIWYDPIVSIFPDIEIKHTGDWKIKIGKAWISHPTAFSGGILATASKAMEFFFKTDKDSFDTCIIGHTHRSGETMRGNIYVAEGGACCQVEKMDYANGKLTDPQQKGFIVLGQDKDGNRIPEASKRISL